MTSINPKMTKGYPVEGKTKVYLHIRTPGGDSKSFAEINSDEALNVVKALHRPDLLPVPGSTLNGEKVIAVVDISIPRHLLVGDLQCSSCNDAFFLDHLIAGTIPANGVKHGVAIITERTEPEGEP